ncbi:PDR/VanB family oxidoreductase [Gordonia sp. HY002]|uniref:PDR/VanB family oxidoreductase n=1 Tax=Gordonia zhenghanii TaxID=2911516 RepID=UPI001EF05FCB|nr:PDR/VanB family oxidoreductase [Gordonia zhenghanii]MCF8571312.1 PDR/VanB family oxidoreductase [Gordonia zhenghanii]MCF8601836.1 PDR/VanB family oxidoreductase [Gordonia zhenghanii]
MPTHRTLRVTAKDEVADQVVSLRLEDSDGAELPDWQPGAHIDVELDNGLTRQYSLCGEPGDEYWRIAVLRETDGRGGSAYVHDELAVGAEVRTQGPRNHFEFVDADSYLFVAGGIGITPLVPMMEAATRAGSPWRLLYGGRARGSMAFADYLVQSRPDQVTLAPADEVGLLDLESALNDVDDGCVVYCCGPEPLLLAIEDVSQRLGVQLRVERFAAKAIDEDAVDEAFEVELAQSGQVLTVGADESVLSAVLDAGVDADFSCREGTCGTCEVAVLSGDIDHRDSVLDEDEAAAGDVMMICVSRCRSNRLVIDL